MHCAYPLIGLLTAWRSASWRTRPIHIAYTLVMAGAAVYLDHHWLIDVLAGWATALVAVVLADRLVDRLDAARPAATLASPKVSPTFSASSPG
jgi:membrane-associated phospholipid phosphatase